MLNTNFTQGCGRNRSDVWGSESRLVHEVGKPGNGETASRTPGGELQNLSGEVNQTALDGLRKVLAGKKTEEVTNSPESLGDTIRKVADVFKKLEGFGKTATTNLDKLYAAFAPLGVNPDDIDRTLAEPPEEDLQIISPAQEMPEFIKPKGVDEATSKKQYALAAQAKNIAESKGYMPYIQAAASEYEIPVATLVAIMAKESGMNPNARAKTGAQGLAQVMPGTLKEYKKKYPDADPNNPRDATLMVAWYARNVITSVNKMVSSGKLDVKHAFDATQLDKLYIAYNSGAYGYVLYCKYMDNQTPENFAKMKSWQREEKPGRLGKYGYKKRANYAKEVAEVAYHYTAITQQMSQ